MSEEKKPNMLIVAIILVIAGVIVTTTVIEAVVVIDTTGMHPYIVWFIQGTKYVAGGTLFAVIFAFGRGLTGYAINWIRAERVGDPHVSYSITWLSETISKFEGWVLLVTPFIEIIIENLSPEYKALAMPFCAGLFALIDMLISEIKYAVKEAKKEPVVSSVPSVPAAAT